MARQADPQRRDAILAAARTVFLRDGYKETRMADVAAEAGIAVGTLYLYFPGKDDLVQALVDGFFQRLTVALQPLIADPAALPPVAAVTRAAFAVALENRDLFRLRVGLIPGRPGAGPRQRFTQELAAVLAVWMARGLVRLYDPLVLADLLVGLLQRAIMTCIVAEEGDSAAYEATLVTFLEQALLPLSGGGSNDV